MPQEVPQTRMARAAAQSRPLKLTPSFDDKTIRRRAHRSAAKSRVKEAASGWKASRREAHAYCKVAASSDGPSSVAADVAQSLGRSGASGGVRPRNEDEASRETARIVGLRRDEFQSTEDWGFAVLRVVARDPISVQRSYRILMKQLHPDRVGSANVSEAVELVRAAKDICQQSLLTIRAPGTPCDLTVVPLCHTPGSRKFRLQWRAPVDQTMAPVRKYMVAVYDPSYGKPITVSVLEPDYNEAEHRFVTVDELTSFELAEENLRKMPALWKQQSITAHIAASNEAGVSMSVSVKVQL